MQKVRGAEDAWNSRDPDRVVKVYTEDTLWRNRAEFPRGRAEVHAFLVRKWASELDYRLIKELWAFTDNRIAVRFAYEWHDASGQWFRSYGNENWEFNAAGFMQRRFASINDLPISEAERKFHWPLGRRPDDHPSLRLTWGYRPNLAPTPSRVSTPSRAKMAAAMECTSFMGMRVASFPPMNTAGTSAMSMPSVVPAITSRGVP